MTKDQFYRGKHAAGVEWWLHACDLPALTWARLRQFPDGTADVCRADGGKLYGFVARDDASFVLSEDEYESVHRMDEEDERDHGIDLADITAPSWTDRPDQPFEYLGTY